jgi:flagellar P-ring protein FlgI
MRRILSTLSLLAFLGCSAHAAVKIADITRLSGQRDNKLVGWGLVLGLKGTGDGGDFAAITKPLRQLLEKLENRVELRELANVQNVALVTISVTVPNGARNGDKLDAYVVSAGAATSLRGGRLFLAPLAGPRPDAGVFAMAEGPVTIEDTTSPLHGVIKAGATMEADMPAQVIEDGRLNLVIDEAHATWTTASTIAKIVNDAEGTGEALAIAVDRKNVIVLIPRNEQLKPDSFISRIQQLPVRVLADEARVIVNEKTGTIVMTGDVEISPCVISHKGLTITTVLPPPTPTPRNPVTRERRTIGLDTTNQGGAKLQELVDAMDMIKVPAEDRIAIIRELHKTGKLHAKLEEQ